MTDSTRSSPTRIILVRHGQSVANAGGVTVDHRTNPLTELGRTQARDYANAFSGSPTLFVVSPFLRAHQTAEPILERFPEVPVEQWPIHEFTYLEPTQHSNTTEEQRMPHVLRFWQRSDPAYCDGPNAESFSAFTARAREAIARLLDPSPGGCVVLFTHGYWMQSFRMSLLFPNATDLELMKSVRRFHQTFPIRNVDELEFEIYNGRIRAVGQEHLNTFELQGETSHA